MFKVRFIISKKASFNIMTFLIIVVTIVFILLLGTHLISNVGSSINDAELNKMVVDIKNNADLMLNENAGVTKEISVIVPGYVTQVCFMDYGPAFQVAPNPRIQNIANSLNTSSSPGIYSDTPNFFVLTNNDFRLYYIERLVLDDSDAGVYCMEPAGSRINFLLKSQGKSVMVK